MDISSSQPDPDQHPGGGPDDRSPEADESNSDDAGTESTNGGFLGDSMLLLIPWPRLRPEPDRAPRSPLIDAQLDGRQVQVVKPEIITHWADTWQIALVCTRDTADQVDVLIHRVDLRQSFTDAGILSDTVSTHALVIENSRGIQVGRHNRQHTVHEFTVTNIRLVLDKFFEHYLTHDAGTTVSPQINEPYSTATSDWQTKIVVKNSHGVQIGNYNKQNNLFRHTISEPEVQLGSICRPTELNRIIELIRDDRINSAEANLTEHIRHAFELDPSRLYDPLPGQHNQSSPSIPAVIRDVTGGQYGPHGRATHREHVTVPGLDLQALSQHVNEFDEHMARQQELIPPDSPPPPRQYPDIPGPFLSP